MVALGTDSGVATTALLTDMNVPLELAIGNANEVRRSVEILAGSGPSDVRELTIALAREMLALAERRMPTALDDRTMDTWKAMIRAQDGDPDAALPTARETHQVLRTGGWHRHAHGRLPVRRRRVASGCGARQGTGPGDLRGGYRSAREAG